MCCMSVVQPQDVGQRAGELRKTTSRRGGAMEQQGTTNYESELTMRPEGAATWREAYRAPS